MGKSACRKAGKGIRAFSGQGKNRLVYGIGCKGGIRRLAGCGLPGNRTAVLIGVDRRGIRLLSYRRSGYIIV